MKDNKKKKDRRKYPQGSAASHAGQNSGNHGGPSAFQKLEAAEKPQDAADGSRKLEKL